MHTFIRKQITFSYPNNNCSERVRWKQIQSFDIVSKEDTNAARFFRITTRNTFHLIVFAAHVSRLFYQICVLIKVARRCRLKSVMKNPQTMLKFFSVINDSCMHNKGTPEVFGLNTSRISMKANRFSSFLHQADIFDASRRWKKKHLERRRNQTDF